MVPGSADPQGYSRCWLPPAAAYSHSASLGRNPPSQIQNAYASYQVSQLSGRFSPSLAEGVHVAKLGSSQPVTRSAVVGATLLSSDAIQPRSEEHTSEL